MMTEDQFIKLVASLSTQARKLFYRLVTIALKQYDKKSDKNYYKVTLDIRDYAELIGENRMLNIDRLQDLAAWDLGQLMAIDDNAIVACRDLYKTVGVTEKKLTHVFSNMFVSEVAPWSVTGEKEGR